MQSEISCDNIVSIVYCSKKEAIKLTIDDKTFNKIFAKIDMVILLLAKASFTSKQVREIVTKGRGRNAAAFLKAYNLCDGSRTQAKVAKEAGIDPGALSRALQKWEEGGIIYRIRSESESIPNKVFNKI